MVLRQKTYYISVSGHFVKQIKFIQFMTRGGCMTTFNVENYRKVLKKCDIALIGSPVKGSLIYLPYGYKIREKLYGIGILLLKEMGFQQIELSDLIDEESIKKIDAVSKISKNYFHIENTDFCMTAGHEVSFYSLVRELLKDHSRVYEFPMQYFHFGSVYRAPKNTRFPFNYGERKSFLECYSIHKTSEDALNALELGVQWNRKVVKDILHLPGVEVERPRATNKQFSQKSIHIDTITPLGETIITGMTYFHNDVFTKALNVKRRENSDGKNYYVYSYHFGLSENVLHSYLMNCYDGAGFKFFSFLAPIQISVIDATGGMLSRSDNYNSIFRMLDEGNFDYEKINILPKNLNKKVKSNSEKGIPVTIILKNNGGVLEIRFLSCGEEFVTSCEELHNNILKYFHKNDETLISRFEEIEKNTIVECNSINEIIQVAQEGKIAKFYCEKSDEKVIKIESYLNGGEVLGFQESTKSGIDIIDNKETSWIAFVSRRS